MVIGEGALMTVALGTVKVKPVHNDTVNPGTTIGLQLIGFTRVESKLYPPTEKFGFVLLKTRKLPPTVTV